MHADVISKCRFGTLLSVPHRYVSVPFYIAMVRSGTVS